MAIVNCLRNFVMLSKVVTSFVVALGLAVPAAASDYYVGISDVDTELSGQMSLDDGGYALTIGKKLDLFEAVDTAVELSYVDSVDSTIEDEDYSTGFTVESLDLSLVASRAYGSFRPFVRVGISQLDTETSGEIDDVATKEDETLDYYGFGVDYAATDRVFLRAEMTEGETDGVTIELFNIGVFTRF
jgi:hypothetical protein